MSTKSKKTTTVTSSSSSTTSYSSPQTGGTMPPGQRPRSPLSPTRLSRLQEKVELQNLNDRLACYMDKVRSLESENTRLSREVQISQESITREVTAFRSIYDQELSDTRKLLDEIAKERAKAEIDNKRLAEENDDLRSSLDKKTKECRNLEASLNLYEHRSADLQTKYNQVVADKKKLDEDLKDALKELEKLRKLYDQNKKYMENETLTRVELENKLQSLKEEVNFKQQMYDKEVTELRTKKREEISEIDGRLTVQYEDKLQQVLQELREQHELQQQANKEEITALYENKIKNLQNYYQRNSTAAYAAVDELRTLQTRYDSLNSTVANLEAANAALNTRVRELEKLLELERTRNVEQLGQMELELTRLREEMANQLKDYHDLMDIKVVLDTEISAYRKMLEFEEHRLNITPSGASTAASSTRRGTPLRRTPVPKLAKRRRLMEDTREVESFRITDEAKGDIEVTDVDPDAKFIELHNKSSKEVPLGGWTVKHVAGAKETVHKFHRSVKVEPNGRVTVWSADSGHTHAPPEHILMKQKWFKADFTQTSVMDNEGEVVATRQRQLVQYSSGLLEQEGEDLQDGDPKREACCVM